MMILPQPSLTAFKQILLQPSLKIRPQHRWAPTLQPLPLNAGSFAHRVLLTTLEEKKVPYETSELIDLTKILFGAMDPIIHRSWMDRRRASGEIGATMEFRNGCDKFLDYAYSHPICVNSKNQIRCPCKKCKNTCYQDRDLVKFHLLVSGFMPNYVECWWAHGQDIQSFISRERNQLL